MRRNIIAALLMLFAFTSNVHAVNSLRSLPAGCDLLGVVRVSLEGNALNAQEKREIDTLIPELRKRCKDRLIRIEGGYASAKRTENYVNKSMLIAMKVEQYLRKNAIKSDLFIGIMDDKLLSDGKSIARIVLYPNNFSIEKIDCQTNLSEKLNSK